MRLDGGRWVDVPVLGHGELLVVVGDEMEIISNVAASSRERMSLVLFYQLEPHRDLEPAVELVDTARPARYKRLGVKAFGDGFWDVFALGEPTIDFLDARVGEEAAAVSGA